jgi:Bacterial membrane protein YfhO
MPLVLYTLTAAALLALAYRFVRPLSRWAALILFLIPFVVFGEALVTSKIVAPVDLPYQTVPLSWMKADHGIEEISPGFHSDVYTEFVPWRQVLRWSLANGEWGLRDPFALSGDVLLAAQQAAVFWPLTWIALLMPAALSFTFTGATTLLIAAICAFLLARELECEELASLIAAAGWALSTAMLSFALVTMSATWAWCPLLLVAVRRVIRGEGFALLMFVFTALLYSSHPESAVLSILIGLLFAAFELIRHREHALRAIVKALAAGAIALLLSAIHLLPFLEAMPQSMEHAHRAEVSAVQPARPNESLARAATSFVPYLHSRHWTGDFEWFDTGVVGSVLLALAVFAVIRVRSGTSWFFAGLATFCLLGHMKWWPLVLAMQKVPLLNIALTDRLSYGLALSLCVLAAMGVQRLTRSAAVVMAVVIALLALANWWAVHTPLVVQDPRRFGEYAIVAELVLLAVAAVITARRPLPAARFLLAIVILQRALSEHGLYKSFDTNQAYPPIAMFEAIDRKTPFRITGHGNALIPHTASMYGLEDVRGFPALTNLRYAETYPAWCIPQPVFYNRVDDLTRPFLSFLNVKYAITWDRDPPPAGWREVARQKGSMLFENTRVLDRAFVPALVRFGPWTEMSSETDFSQRAWIEADLPPGERPNGPGRVTIRNVRLGYDIDADMDGDGWIVTSITAWKGWRAYVDGRRVKTQFANHAFLGIHVPRGKHRVELRYWPESFVRGMWITAITLIAVIGLGLWHRRQTLLQRRDPAIASLSLRQ